MSTFTPHSDLAPEVHACQQAYVLRTRHWAGANLWSPHPVLEAQLLDVDGGQWAQLDATLRALTQALGLTCRVCHTEPQTNGRGTVVVEVAEAALGRSLVKEALELLALPEAQRHAQWAGALARVRHVVDDACMGPSTACIADAAVQRGLPHYRLFPKGNLVQLGMGAAQQRIWTAESDLTGAIGQDIASDKSLTKRLLANAGLPTPQGEIAPNPATACAIAQRLGVPVVVKPLDGNRARGVSLELVEPAAIEAAWYLAKAEGTQVMVERCIQGHEHRVLVVGDRVVAATRGETLDVLGDGQSTVAALVEAQINQHPRCLVDNTLERIELATHTKVQVELQRQQLHAQSIPADGQVVRLLRTGNLTVDCTDDVHPDVARTAVMAARTIGLDIAGIDMVVQDIRQPLLPQGGAIVEVNAGPSLLMHLYPVQGQPRAVGEAICQHLFPTPASGRIPLVGILAGPRSGTRMARALGQWLATQGHTTGVACGEQLYLQDQRLPQPPSDAPPPGHRALMHRAVTAAVVAQTPQAAQTEGWAYAQCDVSILTGEDAALEPAVHQRLLAAQLRAVRPDGAAILTTPSASLQSLALACPGRVVWVDADEQHPVLQAHLHAQGAVVFVRGSHAVCAYRSEELQVLLPTPLHGWQLDEWLAVVAAGWQLQLPLQSLPAINPPTDTQDL